MIKFITGFIALVVAFLLLLVWNIRVVIRRERDIKANLRMSEERADLEDNRIKSFLQNCLIDPCYGVAKCYAFGSIVRQYPTRDVDIVIQFDSSKECQVRAYRDRLRRVESNFEEFHELKLHIQTFLSSEDEALNGFLIRAEVYETIL